MRRNRKRHRNNQLLTRRSRRSDQTMPEHVLALSAMSGMSVLAFSPLSHSTANAITGLVGLVV